MNEPKIKPSDLRRQAEELHQSGKLPKLEEVLAAVAEARKKYSDKILAARNEHPADTLAQKDTIS